MTPLVTRPNAFRDARCAWRRDLSCHGQHAARCADGPGHVLTTNECVEISARAPTERTASKAHRAAWGSVAGDLPESDFGPPRLVRDWDAYEAEVARQNRLRGAGLLRRHDGVTWGWGPATDASGKTVWGWQSPHGTYLPRTHKRREDHEAAWSERFGTHES